MMERSSGSRAIMSTEEEIDIVCDRVHPDEEVEYELWPDEDSRIADSS